MLKVSVDQLAHVSDKAEEGFAEKLRRHLEHCCPEESLPSELDPRRAFVRERIQDARAQGLTWEATIAEHARLFVLRNAGVPAPDPNALVGKNPDVADSRFADSMRRAGVLGGPGGAR